MEASRSWGAMLGTHAGGVGLVDDIQQLDSPFLADDFSGLEPFGNDDLLFPPTSDVLDSLDLPLAEFRCAGTPGVSDALFDPLRPPSPQVDVGLATRNSPSTSESGNPRAPGCGGNSSSDEGRQGEPQEDEAKRLARMQRNRENAHLSRQRKKQQMQELQQQCTQLRGQNTQLTCLVHRMVAENCLLRHHLGVACKQANIPVPEVPSAMKASQAQPAASRGPPEAALAQTLAPLAVQQRAATSQPQLPAVVQPQAAQAAPQSSRPTGAAALASKQPPSGGSSSMNTRKRARTTTATGAAFLALFSIFMFAAPFAPVPLATQPVSGSLPAAAGRSLAALPAAVDMPVLHGRSLQALPPTDGSGALTTGRHPGLAAMMNQTLEALLQDPASQQLQANALQHLQELAPAAVLLDEDKSEAERNIGNPLAASTAFPLLAGELFNAAGLQAPQICQKVFEFDAASLPHAARSRRSVERYVMGAHGFKGRSLPLPQAVPESRAVELPAGPSDGAVVLQQQVLWQRRREQLAKEPLRIEEGVQGTRSVGGDATDVMLPAAVDEPLLVSLLLPANASHGEGTGGDTLSAVDRVFVVLLHPQDRYVTYSCGLSRPVLV